MQTRPTLPTELSRMLKEHLAEMVHFAEDIDLEYTREEIAPITTPPQAMALLLKTYFHDYELEELRGLL